MGFLPRQVIRRVVEKRARAVRRCWEAYLKAHPSSAPRFAVRFVINPKGYVESVEARGTSLDSAEVVQCAVDIVKRLRFPAPRAPPGYLRVTYPFILDVSRG